MPNVPRLQYDFCWILHFLARCMLISQLNICAFIKSLVCYISNMPLVRPLQCSFVTLHHAALLAVVHWHGSYEPLEVLFNSRKHVIRLWCFRVVSIILWALCPPQILPRLSIYLITSEYDTESQTVLSSRELYWSQHMMPTSDRWRLLCLAPSTGRFWYQEIGSHSWFRELAQKCWRL